MEYTTVQHDSLTKQTIERDATSDEIKVVKKLQSKIEANKLAEQEKAEAKLVAHAKLAALGLTVEDLTALGL